MRKISSLSNKVASHRQCAQTTSGAVPLIWWRSLDEFEHKEAFELECKKGKKKALLETKIIKQQCSIIFVYYGSTNVASAVFTSLLVGPPKVTWTDIVFQTTAITSVIFICNKPVRIGSSLNKKIWRSNWGQPESKLHKIKPPNPQFDKFINLFFWPRCAV